MRKLIKCSLLLLCVLVLGTSWIADAHADRREKKSGKKKENITSEAPVIQATPLSTSGHTIKKKKIRKTPVAVVESNNETVTPETALEVKKNDHDGNEAVSELETESNTPGQDTKSLEDKVTQHIINSGGFPEKSSFIESVDSKEDQVAAEKDQVVSTDATSNSTSTTVLSGRASLSQPSNHAGESASISQESVSLLARMFWGIFLTVLVMLALASIWYFLQKKPWSKVTAKGPMKILARQVIGTRAQAVIIQAYGRKILVGITPDHVQTLLEFDEVENTSLSSMDAVSEFPVKKDSDDYSALTKVQGEEDFGQLLAGLSTTLPEDRITISAAQDTKQRDSDIKPSATSSSSNEFKPGLIVTSQISESHSVTENEDSRSAMDKVREKMKGMKKIVSTH